MTDAAQNRTKYPRWLIVLTAALTLMQFGAAIRAVQVSAELAAQVAVPMGLEIVAGLFWAGFSLWTLHALLTRKPHVKRQAAWLWAGFLTYSALRWLLFVRAEYDTQRLPLLLILTILLLIIPCSYLLRPKPSFTENVHDTKSQD